MEKTGRIINENVNVDDNRVHDFFDNRVNKKLFHRYNLVNYQDNHPEVALERDKAEKAFIFPYLMVKEDTVILDIGCGVGRWGDRLTTELESGKYIGVDYSDKIIEVAKKVAIEDGTADKRLYFVGRFQDIIETLEKNNIEKVDLIIINGTLMYINDCDISKCLKSLPGLLNDNGRIYIKESVGINNRYTLKDIYSEELGSQYSAIYRSVEEYNNVFSETFVDLKLLHDGEIFKEGILHNRKETTVYYWIFEKTVDGD